MLDPQTSAWLDQDDANVAQLIRKHGWMIQSVGFGGCECCEDGGEIEATPFSYTIGLFGLGHPELLIFSTSVPTAMGVLNELGGRIQAGDNLVPGQMLTFDEWEHRIVVEEVPNPGEIVFGANRHYQRPAEVSVPVFQLTYDDKQGRFPWDEGYANAPHIQPCPGTFQA